MHDLNPNAACGLSCGGEAGTRCRGREVSVVSPAHFKAPGADQEGVSQQRSFYLGGEGGLYAPETTMGFGRANLF